MFFLFPVAFASLATHTCLQTIGFEVVCWGSNTHGQLGRPGTAPLSPLEIPIVHLETGEPLFASHVSTGSTHTCAVTLDELTVFCWGNNANGQLGIISENTIVLFPLLPVDLPFHHGRITSLSCGAQHSCVSFRDGTARCWGGNVNRVVGQPVASNLEPSHLSTQPIVLPGDGIRIISCGGMQTCALTYDSAVYCWGSPTLGSLGRRTDGSLDEIMVDSRTEGIDNLVEITFGEELRHVPILRLDTSAYHSCVVFDTNEFRCWGSNLYGELGSPSLGYSSNSDGMAGNSPILARDIAVGVFSTCVLTPHNKVICFGLNDKGQLGYGSQVIDTDTESTPLDQYPALLFDHGFSATRLVAGKSHYCVVLETMQASCWGDNSQGAVGPSTMTFPIDTIQYTPAAPSPFPYMFFADTLFPVVSPPTAPPTAAPATESPTTAAPATESPTTAAPATEAPTTAAPATESPTTAAPETKAPSPLATTQQPVPTTDAAPDAPAVPPTRVATSSPPAAPEETGEQETRPLQQSIGISISVLVAVALTVSGVIAALPASSLYAVQHVASRGYLAVALFQYVQIIAILGLVSLDLDPSFRSFALAFGWSIGLFPWTTGSSSRSDTRLSIAMNSVQKGSSAVYPNHAIIAVLVFGATIGVLSCTSRRSRSHASHLVPLLLRCTVLPITLSTWIPLMDIMQGKLVRSMWPLLVGIVLHCCVFVLFNTEMTLARWNAPWIYQVILLGYTGSQIAMTQSVASLQYIGMLFASMCFAYVSWRFAEETLLLRLNLWTIGLVMLAPSLVSHNQAASYIMLLLACFPLLYVLHTILFQAKLPPPKIQHHSTFDHITSPRSRNHSYASLQSPHANPLRRRTPSSPPDILIE